MENTEILGYQLKYWEGFLDGKAPMKIPSPLELFRLMNVTINRWNYECEDENTVTDRTRANVNLVLSHYWQAGLKVNDEVIKAMISHL